MAAQKNHHRAADECLMLRYKNSLLERILLEKGMGNGEANGGRGTYIDSRQVLMCKRSYNSDPIIRTYPPAIPCPQSLKPHPSTVPS